MCIVPFYVYSYIYTSQDGIQATKYPSSLSSKLLWSICLSLLSLIILKILLSSANRYASDSTACGKSLISREKSRGPSTDPCRIPDVTSLLFWLAFYRYSLISSCKEIFNPFWDLVLNAVILNHFNKPPVCNFIKRCLEICIDSFYL